MMYYIFKTIKMIRWGIRKIIKIISFSNPYKEGWEYIQQFLDIRNLKPATGKLRETQLRSLAFAKEITGLLEKNDIKPILGYGALLGAERHKGFIPWDDDIDFDMSRGDYEKVIKLAKEKYIYIKRPMNRYWSVNKILEFEDELIQKNPNKLIFIHSYEMIQVYKGTSLKDFQIIDLFPLDYYAENYSYEEHKKYLKKIKRKLESINNFPKEIDFLEKEIRNNPNIVKHGKKIMYGIDSCSSFTNAMTYGEWYKEEDWYPLKKIKFEDTEFWAPNDHISVLENEFRNWNNFPQNLEFSKHFLFIQNYLIKKNGKEK